MAGFEDLIRNALSKQGDASPQQRQAIYQSSRQALERMLEKNTTLDGAAVAQQRQRLESAILAIEQGYAVPPAASPPSSPPGPPPSPPLGAPLSPAAPVARAPVPPQPAPAPKPAPQPSTPPITPVAAPMPQVNAPGAQQPRAPETKFQPQPAGGNMRVEPGFTQPIVPPPPDPDGVDEVSNGAGVRPNQTKAYDENLLREKKPYAKMLLWTIILVGLAISGWWIYTYGPGLLRQQFDGSVPNPSPTLESSGFTPEGGEGWVSVFAADTNPENLDFANRGRVELIRAEGRTFARLSSNSGSTGNTILVKVPRGVMQSIRGKAATFEMVLRSVEDGGQQFAIFCEFGEMGNCGRKRFAATGQLKAYIFDVLINDTNLASGEDAYLAVSTDMDLAGKPVDLFSVRVRSSGN